MKISSHYRNKIASILGLLCSLYLFMIFFVILFQKKELLQIDLSTINGLSFSLTDEAKSMVALSLGHFAINALIFILASTYGLQKKKEWAYLVFLIGFFWIFPFDFLATRIFIKIVPTPLIPGTLSFIILLLLYPELKKIKLPKLFSFNKSHIFIYFASLSYLSLSLVGLLMSLWGHIFPIELYYFGPIKLILLSIVQMGFANMGGVALLLLYLSHANQDNINNINKILVLLLSTLVTGVSFGAFYFSVRLAPYLIAPIIFLIFHQFSGKFSMKFNTKNFKK